MNNLGGVTAIVVVWSTMDTTHVSPSSRVKNALEEGADEEEEFTKEAEELRRLRRGVNPPGLDCSSLCEEEHRFLLLRCHPRPQLSLALGLRIQPCSTRSRRFFSTYTC